MKNKILCILFSLFCFFSEGYAKDEEGNTYKTPERLFYISRSANKNLVCYDINLKEGKMDSRKPLKVYWVNREEHPGKIGELSFIQRKLAYGYKLLSSQNDICICSLTAYPSRRLTIEQQGDKYICLITINNEPAILQSLYVKANPRNPLNVEYVKLTGLSLSTQREVTEIVKR